MIAALKQSRAVDETGEEEYDLLVVGGGATGAGVAVDAASRGLRIAVVERDDFSAGQLFLAKYGRTINFDVENRYFVEINQTRPRRRALSAKSRVRIGL